MVYFTELVTDRAEYRDQTVAEESINTDQLINEDNQTINITHFASERADWSPQGFSDVFVLWQFGVTETKNKVLQCISMLVLP